MAFQGQESTVPLPSPLFHVMICLTSSVCFYAYQAVPQLHLIGSGTSPSQAELIDVLCSQESNGKVKVLPNRQGLLIYPTGTSTQLDLDKCFSSAHSGACLPSETLGLLWVFFTGRSNASFNPGVVTHTNLSLYWWSITTRTHISW